MKVLESCPKSRAAPLAAKTECRVSQCFRPYRIQFTTSLLLPTRNAAISLDLGEQTAQTSKIACFRPETKRLTPTIGGSTKAGFREHILRVSPRQQQRIEVQTPAASSTVFYQLH